MEDKGLLEIVEACGKQNPISLKDGAEQKVADLKELGFSTLAEKARNIIEEKKRLAKISEYGYIRITPKAIEDFLIRKAKEYDRLEGEKKKVKSKEKVAFEKQSRLAYTLFRARVLSNDVVYVPTLNGRDYHVIAHDYLRYENRGFTDHSRMMCETLNNGMRYLWDEAHVSVTKHCPPQNILDAMKIHKERGIFDLFTVAEVIFEPIPVKDPLLLGRIYGSSDRFFIGQWGEDVALDDLI